ncbi:Radical SAM domain protein [Methanococcus vannielii SB]|uniref:Radical SAM domain protein n=1 Tax=Methanococcus vannielii (strain ATCC 35089 / DSM 1224 / JCM 13029 / OCM 148 / SB) TaxID=406327 RepID=A6URY8_METVS|nr:radical SAM protein [Methanococcus vannielii]ABR55260.1 Radical SAM domain protein [Methanococcus vannielii SB]
MSKKINTKNKKQDDEFFVLNLNQFRMITGYELSNNDLILEINKNYEVIVPIEYNVSFKDGKLIFEDFIGEKSDSVRALANSLKSGILNKMSQSIVEGLTNNVTNRRTYYINEGIPLIGHTAFGLIDRGTNVIQIRGLSGCNINCPFCSVDEGNHSKSRKNDYYVDMDYLVSEYKKIADFKGNTKLEAHLDGQGEPSLYYPLLELVQELNEINGPKKGIVSIQSNGVNLNEKLIDDLADSGLHRINMSINAIDEKLSKGLSGKKDYDINKILEISEYIKNSKIHLLIAPILLPNYNDTEFKKVLDYAVNLQQKIPQNTINPINNKKNPILGAQLCLTYQFGRKVPKMKTWDFNKFYGLLANYEKEYSSNGINVNLKVPLNEYFGSHVRTRLPCPFKVNDVISATVLMDGRVNGEIIASSMDRIIQVINCKLETCKIIGKRINVKVLRTKDNIIVGTLVK